MVLIVLNSSTRGTNRPIPCNYHELETKTLDYITGHGVAQFTYLLAHAAESALDTIEVVASQVQV
jgi:hypothetical protein